LNSSTSFDGRTIPVIVTTAKDLAADDRERLTGQVARILQKGATSREDLLNEVRRLLACTMGDGI
jgi:hypothetical protein